MFSVFCLHSAETVSSVLLRTPVSFCFVLNLLSSRALEVADGR